MAAHPLIVAVTTGEPAGIGPDVALTAAHVLAFKENLRVVLIGDRGMLQQRAALIGMNANFVDYRVASAIDDGIAVIDQPLPEPSQPGKLDERNGRAVLAMLDRAIDGALAGEFAAVVTAPVQKSVINVSGVPFSGHTEYFAERTASARVVMMLIGGGIRVALATTHLPLRAVADAITEDSLIETLSIIDSGLRRWFGIDAPRILIAGLNPHAGESGYLGMEEIQTIIPAIAKAHQNGIHAKGPFPADTLFQTKYLDACDVVLAMYHDQGLPVLKYASFGHGVNVTLGLPIVRTSVDHGTALDLAGTGRGDASSMIAALETAIEMALSGRNRETSGS